MAIELKDILQTMEKTYGFVVKIACEDAIDPNSLKMLDTILKAKGMKKRSEPHKLPLAAQPFVFKRLEGFVGNFFTFEMEFEYPITPSEIADEISTLLCIGKAYVVVRTAEDPFNKIEQDYLEYDEEDYLPQMVNDEMPHNINEDELVGDAYNKELVKKLQSKEAKKYQHQWSEVDGKMYHKGA